jgi:hypothetical protein
MSFGVIETLILGTLCCVVLVVLAGIAIGIAFLNKRSSQSS